MLTFFERLDLVDIFGSLRDGLERKEGHNKKECPSVVKTTRSMSNNGYASCLVDITMVGSRQDLSIISSGSLLFSLQEDTLESTASPLLLAVFAVLVLSVDSVDSVAASRHFSSHVNGACPQFTLDVMVDCPPFLES